MTDLARLQLGQQAVLLRGAALLARGALGQDQPVATPVHLDHLEEQVLAAHGAQLLLDLFVGAAAP